LKIPGAWLAAAIFAIHPVNVESVAWITQRKNTLTLIFFLVTVQWYLTFEDTGRWRWLWLAAGMFWLAMMSKTAIVPLPFVLLGLAWWRRGRIDRKDIQHSLVFFALAAAGSLLAIWIQRTAQVEFGVVRADSLLARLAGAGWAFWFYFYKAVLPLNLVFVYPRWHINTRNVLTYLPLIMLLVAFVVCWRWRRGWGKALFFGLAYFFVMLLPVLGFLNIYFMRFSLVADHWQYFAIIGPIALAAAVLVRKPVLAAALLLALGALTWKQCGLYANEEAFWQATLRCNPDCWLAHGNLGHIYSQQGQINKAFPHFQRALEINPGDVKARCNFGAILEKEGKIDEAIAQYREALQIQPDYAQAQNNLGRALFRTGRVDEAIDLFQDALQTNPDDADALNNLGSALSQEGRADEAIAQLQKALQINPGYDKAHYNLGIAFLQKDRLDEAILQFQQAVQINPGYESAHNNLGIAFARKDRLDEAIIQFQQTLQINPGSKGAQANLDLALSQKESTDQGKPAIPTSAANPTNQSHNPK
jgi:tetratricopeptide (TPR) repeat protein